MSVMRKIIDIILNPHLANTFIQEREIKKMIKKLGGNALILNIGSKNVRFPSNVLNLDLAHSPQVDVVGDAHCLPFKDECVDGVIVTALLEIVENPEKVVNEIHRVLNPQGVILATLPFLQTYHPDPTDFRRFTKEGVEKLFKNFKKEKIINTRGLFSSFLWILRDFLAILFSFNNFKLWCIWNIIFGWLLYPFKFLDYMFYDFKFQYYISSSFLYLGEKRESGIS